MRYFFKIILPLLLMAGCNNAGDQPAKTDAPAHAKTDTLQQNIPPKKDSAAPVKNDSALLRLSAAVLQCLKTKDFRRLATFTDTAGAIRFSPYGYVDTLRDQQLSAKQLAALYQNKKKIRWGNFDGTGAPINLDIEGYFSKFVYDVDFLTAPKKAVDKMLGSGTSKNNLQAVYPGCDFTEFYFPGINPKLDGMDWKTLRLVFRKAGAGYHLVAVVHDQWTS